MVLDAGAVVVDELSLLPTDRRVALRLLWLLDDPRAPLDEIGRVIAADPALAARVLSVANAPYYGAPGEVTTISRAVTLLGMTAVRTLATTAALELFSGRDTCAPDGYWLHSMTAAVTAASIANRVGINPAEALVAALLHDVGLVMLRARDADAFDDFARSTEELSDEDRLAAEAQKFGTDHAAYGARVLATLRLPTQITEAIGRHHTADAKAPLLARVVLAADQIAHVVVGDANDAAGGIGSALHDLAISSDLEPHFVERATADQLAVLQFLANFLAATPRER